VGGALTYAWESPWDGPADFTQSQSSSPQQPETETETETGAYVGLVPEYIKVNWMCTY